MNQVHTPLKAPTLHKQLHLFRSEKTPTSSPGEMTVRAVSVVLETSTTQGANKREFLSNHSKLPHLSIATHPSLLFCNVHSSFSSPGHVLCACESQAVSCTGAGPPCCRAGDTGLRLPRAPPSQGQEKQLHPGPGKKVADTRPAQGYLSPAPVNSPVSRCPRNQPTTGWAPPCGVPSPARQENMTS